MNQQAVDQLKAQRDAALRERDALKLENQRLRDVLKNVTVHLIAAHSLLLRGGRNAAASDKMFSVMLKDYEKSFELGRATLKAKP